MPLASRRKQTTVTSAELNAPAASIENSGKEIVPDNEISITKVGFLDNAGECNVPYHNFRIPIYSRRDA